MLDCSRHNITRILTICTAVVLRAPGAHVRKQACASDQRAMLKMVNAVGQLVAAVMPAGPATASTSTPTFDASRIRCDCAYRRIAKVEGLTPRHLLVARVMFRGRTELANEYLSFEGEDENEVVA
jgi:hypothetical protein